MTKHHVLLVEDDEILRQAVTLSLESDGYVVATADSAKSLEEQLKKGDHDIVLLDLVLPDADGLTLITKIREYSDLPIIITSSKGEMIDRVVGLEMGADDYMSKPLPLRELSSRIKAQLRRYHAAQDKARNAAEAGTPSGRIRFGRWVLDSSKVQVFDENNASCKLTAREFRLLEALVRAQGRVLTREQILDRTRPDDFDITDRAVDVQVLRIRKKIGDISDDSQVIQTVRGAGYMLSAEVKNLD